MKQVLKFELDRAAFTPIVEAPYFAFYRSAYDKNRHLENHTVYVKTAAGFEPITITVEWASEPGTTRNHHTGREEHFTHSWPVYMGASPTLNAGEPFDIYPLTLRNLVYVDLNA